jgi:hypothetical protein
MAMTRTRTVAPLRGETSTGVCRLPRLPGPPCNSQGAVGHAAPPAPHIRSGEIYATAVSTLKPALSMSNQTHCQVTAV